MEIIRNVPREELKPLSPEIVGKLNSDDYSDYQLSIIEIGLCAELQGIDIRVDEIESLIEEDEI